MTQAFILRLSSSQSPTSSFVRCSRIVSTDVSWIYHAPAYKLSDPLIEISQQRKHHYDGMDCKPVVFKQEFIFDTPPSLIDGNINDRPQ